MVHVAHGVLASISPVPKIFVAQISGHALGGGLEIAFARLSIRIKGESRLGVPEVTLGLFPANGRTQHLPRLVGWARALDLMVTGRAVSPKKAFLLASWIASFPRMRSLRD